MPNEIFSDMKLWLEEGVVKSVQHQEFIYSYYWLLSYLWRFALYSEYKAVQSDIKNQLGYNPDDKRLNYIMKKGGLLDVKGYTSTTKNYPILWSKKGREDVQFTMLYDIDEVDRGYLNKFKSSNSFVKKPVKHTGNNLEDGIFWNSANTHIISGTVLELCLNNSRLGCAGFYLYGILIFIQDKSGASNFPCANETLATFTGWSERRIIKITNEMQDIGLIKKVQARKSKGSVNEYQITQS